VDFLYGEAFFGWYDDGGDGGFVFDFFFLFFFCLGEEAGPFWVDFYPFDFFLVFDDALLVEVFGEFFELGCWDI